MILNACFQRFPSNAKGVVSMLREDATTLRSSEEDIIKIATRLAKILNYFAPKKEEKTSLVR